MYKNDASALLQLKLALDLSSVSLTKCE